MQTVQREIDSRNEIQTTTTMPDVDMCAPATTSVHDAGHNATDLGKVQLGLEGNMAVTKSYKAINEQLPILNATSNMYVVKDSQDKTKRQCQLWRSKLTKTSLHVFACLARISWQLFQQLC